MAPAQIPESANRAGTTNQSQFQLSIVVTLFHCSWYGINSAVNTQGISNKGRVQFASCHIASSSFCQLLQTTKLLNRNLPLFKASYYCVKAIYAANAALWNPGEQRYHKQTDKPTDRGHPRAPRVITAGCCARVCSRLQSRHNNKHPFTKQSSNTR